MAARSLTICGFTKNVLKRTPSLFYTQNVRFISDKSNDVVRIGCASGFWGDTPTAVAQLVNGSPKINYLILDYLSEITMSLLTVAHKKNPQLGFTPDFVSDSVGPQLKTIKEKGIKVVTNAGGINPEGCAAAIQQIAEKMNIGVKVGVVTGDGLMNERKEILNLGVKDMLNGVVLPPTVHSMNAYLGAGPIAKALDMGADIVITGRCTDSALALGPLIYEYDWKMNSWDELAGGSLAGHLIECGAQCTGGIFTDWHTVEGWDNNGFPIAEVSRDGTVHISKPDGTGGLVTHHTVGEQMLYEIGDPANYILPDVVCDFSKVTMSQTFSGVMVKGATGKPAPEQYKVSATYMDGWKTTVVCTLAGPKTVEKGEKVADAIVKRCQRIFKQIGLPDFTRIYVHVIGSEKLYGQNARDEASNIREGVIWIACQHSEKKALEILAREVASAGTGMAPGLGTLVGGRPRPSPLLRHHSFLYPKDKFKITITVGDKTETYNSPNLSKEIKAEDQTATALDDQILKSGSETHTLGSLALTRSGDKGDSCNIGVIARKPEYYPYLKKHLTSSLVAEYFKHVFPDGVDPASCVQRWEAPGIYGLNFLLLHSLDGGGIASLRPDPQGKAYAQILLDMKLHDLPSMEDM